MDIVGAIVYFLLVVAACLLSAIVWSVMLAFGAVVLYWYAMAGLALVRFVWRQWRRG